MPIIGNPLYQAAKAARIQEAEKPIEEKQTIAGKAGQMGLSVLGAAGNVLDLPGSSVRDIAVGKNPFDQWLDPLGYKADENRTEGREVLREWKAPISDKDNWWNFGGGLALEMALDPTTYIGVGVLTHMGNAMKKAGISGKHVSRAVQEIAELEGKKLKNVPGSSWFKHVTAKRLFDHADKIRDIEAEKLIGGKYIHGPNKRPFDNADELENVKAQDGAHTIVDDGESYKVYKYNKPDEADGKWELDAKMSQQLADSLAGRSIAKTSNGLRRTVQAAYKGASWEDDVMNMPLHHLVTVRTPKIPFTNIGFEANLSAKTANEWFNRRLGINNTAEAAGDAAKASPVAPLPPGSAVDSAIDGATAKEEIKSATETAAETAVGETSTGEQPGIINATETGQNPDIPGQTELADTSGQNPDISGQNTATTTETPDINSINEKAAETAVDASTSQENPATESGLADTSGQKTTSAFTRNILKQIERERTKKSLGSLSDETLAAAQSDIESLGNIPKEERSKAISDIVGKYGSMADSTPKTPVSTKPPISESLIKDLNLDTATERGRALSQLAQSQPEEWTRLHAPVMDAMVDNIAKESGIDPEELWSNVAFDNQDTVDAAKKAAGDGDWQALFQTVWHGTPHKFEPERLIKLPDGTEKYIKASDDVPEGAEVIGEFTLGRFDLGKVSTGEGRGREGAGQAYGYGVYVADRRGLAEHYRNTLTRGQPSQLLFDGKKISEALNDVRDNGVASKDDPLGLKAYNALREVGKYGGADEAIKNLSKRLGDLEKAIPSSAGDNSQLRRYLRSSIDQIEQWKKDGRLSSKAGSLFKVDLKPKEDEFLYWEKPLSEQSDKVKEAAKKLGLVKEHTWKEDGATLRRSDGATVYEYKSVWTEDRKEKAWELGDRYATDTYSTIKQYGDSFGASRVINGVRQDETFDNLKSAKLWAEENIKNSWIANPGSNHPPETFSTAEAAKKWMDKEYASNPTGAEIYRQIQDSYAAKVKREALEKAKPEIDAIKKELEGFVESIRNTGRASGSTSSTHTTIIDNILSNTTEGNGPAVRQILYSIPETGVKDIDNAAVELAKTLGAKIDAIEDTIAKASSNTFAAKKYASQTLLENGIRGNKMPENFRAGGNNKGNYNYVIFNDKDLEIQELYQKANESAKGKRGVIIQAGTQHVINLFKKKDFTTALHEFAHFGRSVLPPKWQDEAVVAVKEVIGKEVIGANGKWTKEAEEAFADQFEKYLASGQAPTEKLKGVFDKIKDFFLSIYKSWTGNIDEVNPKLRELFDKMLGNEKQTGNLTAVKSAPDLPTVNPLARIADDTPTAKTAPEAAPEVAPEVTTEVTPEVAKNPIVEAAQEAPVEAVAPKENPLAKIAARRIAARKETPQVNPLTQAAQDVPVETAAPQPNPIIEAATDKAELARTIEDSKAAIEQTKQNPEKAKQKLDAIDNPPKAAGKTATQEEIKEGLKRLPAAMDSLLERARTAGVESDPKDVIKREVDRILLTLPAPVTATQRNQILEKANAKYVPLIEEAGNVAKQSAEIAPEQTPVAQIAKSEIGDGSDVVSRNMSKIQRIAAIKAGKDPGLAQDITSHLGEEISKLVKENPSVTDDYVLKFAYTTAHNKMIDLKRRSDRQAKNLPEESKLEEILKERAEGTPESARSVIEEFSEFVSDPVQQMILLKRMDEGSLREVARTTGMTDYMVKKKFNELKANMAAYDKVNMDLKKAELDLEYAPDDPELQEIVEASKSAKQKVIDHINSQNAFKPGWGDANIWDNAKYQDANPSAATIPLWKKDLEETLTRSANAQEPLWYDTIMDMMDKGQHLFFNNPAARTLASLFQKSTMGSRTEEGQDIARRWHEAAQDSTFFARGLMSGVVRTIGETGILDEEFHVMQNVKNGMKRKEAVKEARKRLNKIHGEIVNFLESASPTESLAIGDSVMDPSARKTLEGQLKVLRNVMPEQLLREEIAGMKASPLYDDYVNYFPRNTSRSARNLSERGKAVLNATGDFQKGRAAWTKNLPGGRQVLDEMSMDPVLSGTWHAQKVLGKVEDIDKKINHVLEKYWDRAFDSNVHYDFEKEALNPEGKRFLTRLVTNLAKLSPMHVDRQVPMYGTNFLHDLMKRIEDGMTKRSAALAAQDIALRTSGKGQQVPIGDFFSKIGLDNANAYQNIIRRMGLNEQFEAYMKGKSDFYTKKIKEGYERDGKKYKFDDDGKIDVTFTDEEGELITQKFDGDINDFVRQQFNTPRDFLKEEGIGVSKEAFDEGTRMLKPWMEPEEVGSVRAAFQSLLGLYKAHYTIPFPNFHGRNMLSGAVQNMLYGAFDPTDPLRYAKPIRQAWAIRRGKAPKGISKDLKQFSEEIRNTYGEFNDKTATMWVQDQVFKHGVVGDKQGYHAENLGDAASSLVSQMPGVRGEKGLMDGFYGAFRPVRNGQSWFDSLNPIHVEGSGRPIKVNIDQTPGGKFAALANPNQKRWVWEKYEDTTFMPMRVGQDLAVLGEDMNRIAPYLAFLKQGYDPAEAARMVNKIQFDYSDISEFEKGARAIFPFWTYSKKAAELMFSDLVTNPGGKQAWMIRTANRMQDRDRPAPEAVARSTAIYTGETESGASRYITGLGLSFEDPSSWMSIPMMDGKRAAGEVLSRTRPEIQGIAEMAFGRSAFFDKPLTDLDPSLGRVRENLSELAGGPPSEGQAEPFISKSVEYAASKSPFSRYISTANTLMDDRKSAGVRALQFFTGVRVSDVEPWQKDRIEIDNAAEQLKQYGGRMASIPMVPAWAKDRLDEESKMKVESIQSFIRDVQKRDRERKKKAEELKAVASSKDESPVQ